MSILAPFYAQAGSTKTVTAGAAQDVDVNPAAKQVMITVDGAGKIAVRFKRKGDTTAATAIDTPVLGNTQVVLSKLGSTTDDGHSLVSIFALSGTPTVYVTSGEGW